MAKGFRTTSFFSQLLMKKGRNQKVHAINGLFITAQVFKFFG